LPKRWIIVGDDYESITWLLIDRAASKEQYEAGFAEYEEWYYSKTRSLN
jgi:hypothetical protein